MTAPRRGARPAPAERPPNPPPEVATGLQAIRSHGGRDEELYLSSELGPFEETFMVGEPMSGEENVRFVKNIEKLVRQSREYKSYVSYLRNDLGMNSCSVMPNVDVSSGEVGVEFHHCPLTLYDICELVLSHRLARGQPVTSLTVADEVMALHMKNMVGVVPLLASLHKLAHSGSLVIHPAMVHGNWLELLRSYPDGVAEELLDRLARFVAVTEEDMGPGLAKLRAGPARLRAGVVAPTRDQIAVLTMGRS